MMDHVSPIRLTVPQLNLELILINTFMYFGSTPSWLHCSYLYVSKTNRLGWAHLLSDILTWLKISGKNKSPSFEFLKCYSCTMSDSFFIERFYTCTLFFRLNQNGKHKCFYKIVISIICYSLCSSLLQVMKITLVTNWRHEIVDIQRWI